MSTPTIPAGNLFMDATIWTGVNTANAITISNLQFQPDFVWGKARSVGYGHGLYDSVRGTGKLLVSNNTNSEASNFLYGYISAFNSNGFTATPGSTDNENWNETSATYVGWNWKAGGTAVTNTSGTISSQVSANTTSGFSVVTWTGNNTSGATIGHGLGVAPKLLITKSRTNASSWIVGVGNISGFGVNDYLVLSGIDAVSSSSTFYQAYGTNTFTVGVSASNEMNKTSNNYVTYCFTPIAGYSAFGSYTGNGSSDGPFIYTGFRPRWIMIKCTSTTGHWIMFDSARGTYNLDGPYLYANSTSAENTSTSDGLDFLSNGFKNRNTYSDANSSGATYIYAAFAENPFKYANAR